MSLSAFLKSPATRLIAYLGLLTVVLMLVALSVPWFADLLVPSAPGTEPFPGTTGPTPTTLFVSVAQTAILAVVTLLSALAFTVPIVWIYTVIMRQEGYDRSFVRLMAALPVVVAGVVQVVRGDLALAFALAGIVAAVRFRTTVKDLLDAVFAFAVIGVGLASGTGTFTLAGALSAVFSLLAFALWKANVGDVGPSLSLRHAGIPLAEALVPGVSHKAVQVGNDDVLHPVQARNLDELSEHVERLADYVRADALRKKRKYNTLMLGYARDPDSAKQLTERVLDEHTERWVLVDRFLWEPNRVAAATPATVCVMAYLLRLKKRVEVGKMIDRLECGAGNVIEAAEFKPIKGLRKRLT